MRRLLIVAASAALMSCGSGNAAQAPQRKPTTAAPAARPASFAASWDAFRAAALAGDAARLRAMSRPVVISHGTLDDDPVRRLTPATVPGAVAALVAAPDDDADGKPLRETLAAKKVTVMTNGQRQVGPFVFASGPKGWQLAELYRNPD